MIKYDFLGSWRSTIAESIRVGFTTTNPKGFLLGFSSNISGEYLTIMVSNSGHLRVVFDFGFERQELIFPNKHFGLGQYHDVKFSRKNSGSTVVLKVRITFFKKKKKNSLQHCFYFSNSHRLTIMNHKSITLILKIQPTHNLIIFNTCILVKMNR